MKTLVLTLFFINSALAAFPLIDIKNISGEYLDEEGRAYAEKAFYAIPKAKITHANIDINFSKKEKSLVIKDPSTSVELDFDFSFLNVFKAFSFDGLFIKSDKKLFTIESEVFDLFIEPKKYHLENFLVQTDVNNLPQGDDPDITVLDGLILNGRLEAKKLTFKDFDIIIFDDLRSENPELVKEVNDLESRRAKNAVPMIVRNLKYVVKDGNFNGKALIDSYINLWLRVSGVMKTNEENTQLTITLNKAKLGIFSIRGTLLKMINRLKLDRVTVDGKNIIVNLESIVLGGSEGTSELSER